ncbi:MAG TPA: SGNH/GDSL hydrolase family protein [Patescibacteria group bacterium]
MTQIFILGSSSVYGVGAEHGGWADLIKQTLHHKMYAQGGIGEKIEVFNFGKSGAKIEFAQQLFPLLLEQYGRSGKIITIVSIGGNNSKAETTPTNYASTLEEYESQMSDLLETLKEKSDLVVAVGGGYVDEAKTNPKHNPLTGGKSYFTNERRKLFEAKWQEICLAKNIPFVGVELTPKEWKDEYLYEDGLHPNQKGHQYICDKVLRVLEDEL